MIGSVLKAIEIMQQFSPDQPQLSLMELSKNLGYPKTTLYTILKTLESKGFIERTETGDYALGSTIITLTQSVRINVQLRDRAAPLLRELGEYCGESIYLTIKKDSYCLYIYAIETPHRLLARTAVGDIMPMHCTSVGKAILAFLPGDEVEAILSRPETPEYADLTPERKTALLEELSQARKRGYAVDNSEHEPGVYCIGSPIFDGNGRVFASCSISGTDRDIVGEENNRYSSAIRYTAQEISRRMGYVPKAETQIWKSIANPLREG